MSYVFYFVDQAAELTNAYLSHIVIFLILSTITATALYLRERYEWKSGRFGKRVNISLNVLANGVLRIRTVHEHTMQDIFLSSYARKLLAKAAKKTTISDPFLHFENERDAWLVYNDVINMISSMYSGHMLSAAAQGRLDETQFLIAITWERDEEVRIQKYRVLLVQENVLNELESRSNPDLEVPHHRPRIAALQMMRKQFQASTWPRYQIVSIPKA